MSVVTTKDGSPADANGQPRFTRDELAEQIEPLLDFEPTSAKEFATKLALRLNVTLDGRSILVALHELSAQGKAKRIPNSAGSKQGGWVRSDAPARAADERDFRKIEWPFESLEWVRAGDCGTDTYGRPLTRNAQRMVRSFDPDLHFALLVSDRGAPTEEFPWRYAIMDGKNRHYADLELGGPDQLVPAIVYRRLTKAQEAAIFWKIQVYRTNVTVPHVFNAKVEGKDELALALAQLVGAFEYELGDRTYQIKGVRAVEYCFKRDPTELERSLATFRDAWGDRWVPEGRQIRGLWYFFKNFPVDGPEDVIRDVDDEVMIDALQDNGPDKIKGQLASVQAVHSSWSSDRQMAMVFQMLYTAQKSKMRRQVRKK